MSDIIRERSARALSRAWPGGVLWLARDHTPDRGDWGCRRYQRKIFGKGDGDEITIGRQARLHLKKQNVMLYVTSHAERDIIVLDSKTGSVILG